MSPFTNKDFITRLVEQDTQLEKSPKVEGLVQGAKAALLAAPLGAAVQAIRGKSIAGGAALTGMAAGLLTGLAAGAIQKYRNLKTESDLRYHVRNLLDREPMVYMPPPEAMNQVVKMQPPFDRGFSDVYY